VKRPVAILRNQSGRRVGGRELDPGDVPCDIVVDEKQFVLINCVVGDDYSVALEYRALPSNASQPPDEGDPEMCEAALALYNNAGALEHTHTFRRVDPRSLPRLVEWRRRSFLLTVHLPDGGTYQEITVVVLDRQD
jgi:hypothetical protein